MSGSAVVRSLTTSKSRKLSSGSVQILNLKTAEMNMPIAQLASTASPSLPSNAPMPQIPAGGGPTQSQWLLIGAGVGAAAGSRHLLRNQRRQPFKTLGCRNAKPWCWLEGNSPGRSRTADLRFRKPLLYPAELRGRGSILHRGLMRAEARSYFFFGTFAPFFRASDRPIAIACLRLLTRLPALPDFSCPLFLFVNCFADGVLRLLSIFSRHISPPEPEDA